MRFRLTLGETQTRKAQTSKGLCALVLAGALPFAPAYAQDELPTGSDLPNGTSDTLTATMQEAESEGATEPQNTPSGTGSQRRRAGDKGGVFRPSEDISEDIAITFPVDI